MRNIPCHPEPHHPSIIGSVRLLALTVLGHGCLCHLLGATDLHAEGAVTCRHVAQTKACVDEGGCSTWPECVCDVRSGGPKPQAAQSAGYTRPRRLLTSSDSTLREDPSASFAATARGPRRPQGVLHTRCVQVAGADGQRGRGLMGQTALRCKAGSIPAAQANALAHLKPAPARANHPPCGGAGSGDHQRDCRLRVRGESTPHKRGFRRRVAGAGQGCRRRAQRRSSLPAAPWRTAAARCRAGGPASLSRLASGLLAPLLWGLWCARRSGSFAPCALSVVSVLGVQLERSPVVVELPRGASAFGRERQRGRGGYYGRGQLPFHSRQYGLSAPPPWHAPPRVCACRPACRPAPYIIIASASKGGWARHTQSMAATCRCTPHTEQGRSLGPSAQPSRCGPSCATPVRHRPAVGHLTIAPPAGSLSPRNQQSSFHRHAPPNALAAQHAALIG